MSDVTLDSIIRLVLYNNLGMSQEGDGEWRDISAEIIERLHKMGYAIVSAIKEPEREAIERLLKHAGDKEAVYVYSKNAAIDLGIVLNVLKQALPKP